MLSMIAAACHRRARTREGRAGAKAEGRRRENQPELEPTTQEADLGSPGGVECTAPAVEMMAHPTVHGSFGPSIELRHCPGVSVRGILP